MCLWFIFSFRVDGGGELKSGRDWLLESILDDRIVRLPISNRNYARNDVNGFTVPTLRVMRLMRVSRSIWLTYSKRVSIRITNACIHQHFWLHPSLLYPSIASVISRFAWSHRVELAKGWTAREHFGINRDDDDPNEAPQQKELGGVPFN